MPVRTVSALAALAGVVAVLGACSSDPTTGPDEPDTEPAASTLVGDWPLATDVDGCVEAVFVLEDVDGLTGPEVGWAAIPADATTEPGDADRAVFAVVASGGRATPAADHAGQTERLSIAPSTARSLARARSFLEDGDLLVLPFRADVRGRQSTYGEGYGVGSGIAFLLRGDEVFAVDDSKGGRCFSIWFLARTLRMASGASDDPSESELAAFLRALVENPALVDEAAAHQRAAREAEAVADWLATPLDLRYVSDAPSSVRDEYRRGWLYVEIPGPLRALGSITIAARTEDGLAFRPVGLTTASDDVPLVQVPVYIPRDGSPIEVVVRSGGTSHLAATIPATRFADNGIGALVATDELAGVETVGDVVALTTAGPIFE